MADILKREDWLAVLVYPLAVVLMEAFWIYPWLVWIGLWPLFAESRPALSMLSVIIVLALSLGVTRIFNNRNMPLSYIRTIIVGGGIVVMFLVLRIEYGGGYEAFDFGWFSYFGRMLADTINTTYPVALALPLLIYLWWRGIQLGRTTSYFDNIYRSFVIGMVALILLIIFWQVSSGDGRFEGPMASIGLYIIAFFFFGLAALAICHLYSMRKRMVDKETMTSVWRTMPIMLGVIGGILVIGFLAAGLFSPEFIDSVGRVVKTVWGWITDAMYYVAYGLGFIVEIFVWVLRWIIGRLRQPESPEQEGGLPGSPFEGMENKGIAVPEILTTILQWVVIFVIAALIIFFLARAINRMRTRRDLDGVEEIHESLWSVNNLRDDLRQLFRMMGQRFQRKPKPVGIYFDDKMDRMDIREIYRRMLWEAGRSGVERRKNETPVEYEGRLEKHIPDGKKELSEITDLYSGVRYGDIRPPEAQVDNANGLWPALRRFIKQIRGN